MKVSRAPLPTFAPSCKPFYTKLWVQVLLGMGLAIGFGYLSPGRAIAMRPLGDAFIRLISMIISLIIFCTVVSGIAGMQDMKEVGRVGGKALLYFEIVSTIALLIGLAVGNLVRPGDGFNANLATLEPKQSLTMPVKRKRRACPISSCTSSPPLSLMPLQREIFFKFF